MSLKKRSNTILIVLSLLLTFYVTSFDISESQIQSIHESTVVSTNNLVRNPSFEEGDGFPNYWKHRAICGNTSYTWDSYLSYNGDKSIGILNSSTSCNPENYWYMLDYIPVDFINYSYLFKGYYRYTLSDETNPVGAFGIILYDTEKTYLDTIMFYFSYSSDNWELVDESISRYDYSFVTPAQYIKIGLYSIAYNADSQYSKLNFDDIYFSPNSTEILNNPPDTPLISGPIEGKQGTEYEYTFSATDPDNDDIFLNIHWGESCPNPEWYGPYKSGEAIKFTHAWDTRGTHTISAIAKDIHGDQSEYGILEVSMPLTTMFWRSTIISDFTVLLGKFLENILVLLSP